MNAAEDLHLANDDESEPAPAIALVEPPDGDAPDGDAPDGDAPDGDAPDGDAPDGDAPDGARVLSDAMRAYYVRRNQRPHTTRGRTESMKRLSKAKLLEGAREYPEDVEAERPKTRGDCVNGLRPCPFAGCVHHLYLDVDKRTGSIKINRPDLEVHQMAETCALDLAERDGLTLEETGKIMNITRERVRQVEVIALSKVVRDVRAYRTLLSLLDEGETRKSDGQRQINGTKRSLPIFYARQFAPKEEK